MAGSPHVTREMKCVLSSRLKLSDRITYVAATSKQGSPAQPASPGSTEHATCNSEGQQQHFLIMMKPRHLAFSPESCVRTNAASAPV